VKNTLTSDPGQHGLKNLCPCPAHNLAHEMLLLLLCEVLRKQRPHLHSSTQITKHSSQSHKFDQMLNIHLSGLSE